MKIAVGIPARMDSSRFPGKPLCNLLGKPMIEHVYKRCKLSQSVTEVFVATCDEEIKKTVERFGGKAYMTPKEIARPGLRVAEACKQINSRKKYPVHSAGVLWRHLSFSDLQAAHLPDPRLSRRELPAGGAPPLHVGSDGWRRGIGRRTGKISGC